MGIEALASPIAAIAIIPPLMIKLGLTPKNAGFQVTEQIKVFYKGEKNLEKTMEEYEDYIKSETLSLNLIESNPVDDAYVERQSIEGEDIVLGVLRSC